MENEEGEPAQQDRIDGSGSEDDQEKKHREKKERKKACKERCQSMEKKLDTVTSTLQIMQQMMQEKGFFTDPTKNSGTDNKGKDISSNSAVSETTIYGNAVKRITLSKDGNQEITDEDDPEITLNIKKNRDSSSSEERIDTSYELMEVDFNDQFIADCQAEAAKRSRNRAELGIETRPGEPSDRIIRQAEASKVKLFATKGNTNLLNWNQTDAAVSSANIDENYLIIGAHIEQGLQQKIINNEYVDFAKLIPKGRLGKEEDHRLEIISRGGSTYFVPVSDRDNSVIGNFAKWEQAFRVFSNIYTRAHPQRATELIQYNHIIYTASTTYTWDNVYMYDKEFHMHLSNFPQRNWSIILQQAWAMYLKDKITRDDKHYHASQGEKSNEICRRYNKGKCPNGASCKYQHRCSVPKCGKYGHGAHICRKRNQNNPSNQMTTTSAQQEVGKHN